MFEPKIPHMNQATVVVVKLGVIIVCFLWFETHLTDLTSSPPINMNKTISDRSLRNTLNNSVFKLLVKHMDHWL